MDYLHTQIVAFLDDLNAKTGIITFLQQAWDYVVQEFEDKLLPALQKLWTALQPLMPLLQAMGVVIGVTLLGALVLLVDALTFGVTWFANALTAATNFATFLTNVLVAAINKVEDALNTVFSSPAFKAVSGLVGGAVSGISNVVGGIFSNVTHVQDATHHPWRRRRPDGRRRLSHRHEKSRCSRRRGECWLGRHRREYSRHLSLTKRRTTAWQHARGTTQPAAKN